MKAILYDSELKIMECLWQNGDTQAADLALLLEKRIGWNKNTSYTVIKKLVAKGYVERIEPKFVCHPLLSRHEVEKSHAEELVEKLYGGSNMMFLSAFVKNQQLSKSELDELKDLISNWSEDEG